MANNNERNSVYLFDENGKIFPDILGYMKEVPPRYSIYRSDRRIIISDMMSFEGIYTSADEKADRKILNKYIRRVIENYLKYISLRSDQTKLGTECIKIEIKVYNRFNCEEEKKIFYFRHYVLREDNEVNSYYLVGYSRSAENSNVGIYSTKLNNIIRVSKDIGYSFPDQPKEYSKMKVEDRIQQNGAAFANRVPIKKKSWVYLTASGYNYLYLISVQHLRPIPYEKPELLPEDEVIVINGNKYVYRLTFECSPRQLYNYFFSMGEDAYVPQKFMKNGEEQCNNDETYKLFSDTAVSLYKMYRTENSDENEK